MLGFGNNDTIKLIHDGGLMVDSCRSEQWNMIQSESSRQESAAVILVQNPKSISGRKCTESWCIHLMASSGQNHQHPNRSCSLVLTYTSFCHRLSSLVVPFFAQVDIHNPRRFSSLERTFAMRGVRHLDPLVPVAPGTLPRCPMDGHWYRETDDHPFIELDDGKIGTGKPDQFDGKPCFFVDFPLNQSIDPWSTKFWAMVRHATSFGPRITSRHRDYLLDFMKYFS